MSSPGSGHPRSGAVPATPASASLQVRDRVLRAPGRTSRRAPGTRRGRPHGSPTATARDGRILTTPRGRTPEGGVRSPPTRSPGGTMVTIGDVARLAGVSRSTASYALSGKRTISPEVRRQVDE
ncbi:LacI family DNA-binding transcriptional regulator, partial [Nocardiopsis sp. FR6]|uniref:LacI family DNA-binding transcriptional regulator n=1 Tax=Nocardiopsis sp. FR6 TaxID=2605986 RepID=UPI00351A66F9